MEAPVNGSYAKPSAARVLNGTLRGLDRILAVVSGTLLVGLVVVTFAQVLARYVLNSPFFWAEEIARYMLIALTFLGAAMVWGRRGHVAITFALERLRPGPVKRGWLLVVHLVTLFFFGWMITLGYDYTVFGMRNRSIALGIPMGYVYAPVPISFAIMMIQSLGLMVSDCWPKADPRDGSH